MLLTLDSLETGSERALAAATTRAAGPATHEQRHLPAWSRRAIAASLRDCEPAGGGVSVIIRLSIEPAANRNKAWGGCDVSERRRSDSPLPATLWWCALMLAIYAIVLWLVL